MEWLWWAPGVQPWSARHIPVWRTIVSRTAQLWVYVVQLVPTCGWMYAIKIID